MKENKPEYIEGAHFIVEDEEPQDWVYPREPSKYTPSDLCRRRFSELGGILEGDDIEDAIKYGDLYPAARGCCAFVNNVGGVVFYVIVVADYVGELKEKLGNEYGHEEDTRRVLKDLNAEYDNVGEEHFNRTIVSVWPYVYNREEAWATGRFTGQQLDKIESVEAEQYIN